MLCFFSQSLYSNIIFGTIPLYWTCILDESSLVGRHVLVSDLSYSSKLPGKLELVNDDIALPISLLSHKVSRISKIVARSTLSLASAAYSLPTTSSTLTEEIIKKYIELSFQVIVMGNEFAQVVL